MIFNQINLNRLIFEVTYDDKNYVALFELTDMYLKGQKRKKIDTQRIIERLIDSGRKLRLNLEVSNFRMMIISNTQSFFVFDDCPIQIAQTARDRAEFSKIVEAKKVFNELTKKEISVMKFICTHVNLEELSRELKIKKSTYETHKKNIFRKMNFKSQVEVRKWCDLFLDKVC